MNIIYEILLLILKIFEFFVVKPIEYFLNILDKISNKIVDYEMQKK